ncbi:MAG: hypothetical protein AB7C98_07935, partial [Acidithiobacillus sp.]
SDIYAFTSHLPDLECSIPKSPKFFGADRASLDYRRLLNHMGIHTNFIYNEGIQTTQTPTTTSLRVEKMNDKSTLMLKQIKSLD